MQIESIIPDLLDRKETLIVQGVVRPYPIEEEKDKIISSEVLSVDGILIPAGEMEMTYGDRSREQIWKDLAGKKEKWIYLHGGWNNALTIETNLCPSLSGDIPFAERKVKHIREGLKSPQRPRIYYDYTSDKDSLSGWRDLLRQKGIQLSDEEYAEAEIGYFLLQVGGAPTRWSTLVSLPDGDEFFCPPTTSTPFPGCEYGNGFIVTQNQPEFPEGKSRWSICNVTGSRGPDSIVLSALLVFLRHDEATVKNFYINDAMHRAGQIEKKGGTPPFTQKDVEEFVPAFIETLKPVKEDILAVLSKYDDIQGFQYAVNIMNMKLLGTAVYKMPPSRPYCFVKRSKGWERAV